MSSSTLPLPSPGDSLASGRYALDALIGEGASAAVFRGRDTTLDLPRAVKVLRPGSHRSEEQRRRLRAEARTLSELSHPHILRMYDFGSDGPWDFVVMQLAEGGNLADDVRENGPMEAERAIDYALQTLAALAHAHARGIVHRDVKPQNILLGTDGTALLADFGIALVTHDDSRSTRTGVAMGTMAFMAPEQRLDARSVGPEADVYAVATTLYNLVTDDNPVDLFAAAPDSPRWRGLDPVLAEVIRKAVCYDPADRFPTAQKMANALSDARGALGTHTPPPALPTEFRAAPNPEGHATGVTLAPPAEEPPTRRPVLLTATVGALIAFALILFAVRPWDQPGPSTTDVRTAPTPAPAVAVVATKRPAEPIPEPAPAVAAPAPAPKPVRPAPAAAPYPLGQWVGSMNGRPIELSITGTPEQFAGVLTTRFGANQVDTPLTGSFHAASGTLEWHDDGDLADATDVFLTRDGTGFKGEYTARHGARKGPVVLVERR